MAEKIKTITVKEIFENMDYGSVEENCDLAKVWVKKSEHLFTKTVEESKKTIQNSKKHFETWMTVSATEKNKLLNKLADEIERHTQLICQLELSTREILTKDTKNKSISLTIDYLRYYSEWIHLFQKHLKDYKPYGVCGVYLSDNTPLSTLGSILAPVLAAGNSIILGTSPKIIKISCFIAELCKNVGFPEGLVSVIPVQNIEEFLNNPVFNKIVYIGNLFDKNIINIKIPTEKYLTSLHLGRSSAIIFNNSDIDSAIDCIVDLAWSYKTFPFGINQLYVQESIFSEFVNRFKTKISKLNVEYYDNYQNKNTDILISKEIIANNIKVNIINKIPIQVGYKTFGGTVLTKEDDGILSILPFRTAEEAVGLSNNTKFGFATSVWTENINLANEISSKLKSSIVWINTHGYINANTAFSPIKSNGLGYFGGKEGLLEYLTYNKEKNQNESQLPIIDCANEIDVKKCVEIAKKSYETWNKTPLKTKKQQLIKLADTSESLRTKNSLVEKWIEYIRESTVLYDSINSSFQKGNPELKTIKEPLGIIVIDIFGDLQLSHLKFITSAILSGNAVILINYKKDELLLELRKIISNITPGLFNVLYNDSQEVVDFLLNHGEISAYFNLKREQVYFRQMRNIRHFKNINFDDILQNVTSNKCIWTSSGESFL